MTRLEQVAQLRRDGIKIKDIAAQMGVTVPTVDYLISKAKANGINVKPDRPADLAHIMRCRGIKTGTMAKMVDLMSYECRLWIIEITPEGGSISDTIADFIEDAYLENLEKIKARRPEAG